MTEIDPRNGKPLANTTERLIGIHTIYGHLPEGARDKYMTRVWIGRLRLHVFHRPDEGNDHHDHPWPFWTFPFTAYVESIAFPAVAVAGSLGEFYFVHRQVVPAWRWNYRPADHTHRVLGRWNGSVAYPGMREGKIITLVWRGKKERNWGFLKNRDGKWCWLAWRDYIFNGGHEGPCS